MALIELTTAAVETSLADADEIYFNDVSETPDGINRITFANIRSSVFASGATIDGGGLASFEIPNSAAPTVNADGEIAVDTTITDMSHGLIKYFSGEECVVIAVPVGELTGMSNGDVIKYNATTDEFEIGAVSGGGITNSAGANVMMKSDGTNAVASGFTNATASTLTTSQAEAVLEQTGDAIGASRLRLRNRSGTNGAIFESAVNDLCDFTFAGSASSLGWRMEGRAGGYQTGVKEFQVHDAGTLYHAFSSKGHWMPETTAPAAPAANSVIIYAVDNGAGKTQLMALFSSGAAQQLAIQP